MRKEINCRSRDVSFGKNVCLGRNVITYGKVTIGDNSIIGDNVIIGYPNQEEHNTLRSTIFKGEKSSFENCVKNETRLGSYCVIKSGSVICSGTQAKDYLMCDHFSFIGGDTRIEANVELYYGAKIYNNVTIGEKSAVSGFCCNDSHIGREVAMHGYLVHKYERGEMPGLVEKPPIIENHAVIGMLAVVVGGITIGEGAFVGAGSVVTKNVKPYAVVVGNPARVIGTRKKYESAIPTERCWFRIHK